MAKITCQNLPQDEDSENVEESEFVTKYKSIPSEPPFVIRLYNLNFETRESEISDFFRGLQIADLRLPRHHLKPWLNQGIAEIELETQLDLIHALAKHRDIFLGRRIVVKLHQKPNFVQYKSGDGHHHQHQVITQVEEFPIPTEPPFRIHIKNLDESVSESDILKFFHKFQITELKLPRYSITNLLRGYGQIEFKTREDLLSALELNTRMLKGRPVLIRLFILPHKNNDDGQGHEIPIEPPFSIRIKNLCYSVNENDLFDFFHDSQITMIRLPRTPDRSRLRGFGDIEFETRQDLINALEKNEQILKKRSVYISIQNKFVTFGVSNKDTDSSKSELSNSSLKER